MNRLTWSDLDAALGACASPAPVLRVLLTDRGASIIVACGRVQHAPADDGAFRRWDGVVLETLPDDSDMELEGMARVRRLELQDTSDADLCPERAQRANRKTLEAVRCLLGADSAPQAAGLHAKLEELRAHGVSITLPDCAHLTALHTVVAGGCRSLGFSGLANLLRAPALSCLDLRGTTALGHHVRDEEDGGSPPKPRALSLLRLDMRNLWCPLELRSAVNEARADPGVRQVRIMPCVDEDASRVIRLNIPGVRDVLRSLAEWERQADDVWFGDDDHPGDALVLSFVCYPNATFDAALEAVRFVVDRLGPEQQHVRLRWADIRTGASRTSDAVNVTALTAPEALEASMRDLWNERGDALR